MRSGAALAMVALLASSARADGPEDPLARDPFATAPRPGPPPAPPVPPDPLAVLREPGRSWSYEMVEGPSLEALAQPPGGMPRMRCKVEPWSAPGKLARSVLECAIVPTPGVPPPPAGAATSMRLWLVFDDAGVRQLERRDSDVADRSKTRGLTFPRKLAGTWKLDEKGRDGSRTQVIVREETARVRGTAQKAWVAETKLWAPPAGGKSGEPEREIIWLAPGVGPVLICSLPARSAPAHMCLRLVEDDGDGAGTPTVRVPDRTPPLPLPPPPPPPPPDASKPPPPPPGRVMIASKVALDPSTLKAADVGAKIAAAYLGGVRRCYVAALAKQPRTRGALTLAFTVNAVGKTTMITVKGFDDGVAGCVAKLVNDWKFPIPQSTYAEPRNARFSIGLALEP